MTQPIHGTSSWPKTNPLGDTGRTPDKEPKPVEELPPCQCKDALASSSTSLRARIAAATSLQELCPYARTARPYISFWGSRHVFFEGCRGSVGINLLTQRVLELLKQNPLFNEEERSHGKTVASHIDRLYEQSELLIAERNPLTRGLAELAKQMRLIFDISSPEYIWRRVNTYNNPVGGKYTRHGDYPYVLTNGDCYNKIFLYYTRDQYYRAFGVFPKRRASWMITEGRHPLRFEHLVDFGDRWRVPRKPRAYDPCTTWHNVSADKSVLIQEHPKWTSSEGSLPLASFLKVCELEPISPKRPQREEDEDD